MDTPRRDPTAKKLLLMLLATALACLVLPATFLGLLAATMGDASPVVKLAVFAPGSAVSAAAAAWIAYAAVRDYRDHARATSPPEPAGPDNRP